MSGTIRLLKLAFLCAPANSWNPCHHHLHNCEKPRWHNGHKVPNLLNACTFLPATVPGGSSGPSRDAGNISRCSMPLVAASTLLALQLLLVFLPAPPALALQDAVHDDAAAVTAASSSPVVPGAGLMGSSIVFDNMDEIPPIEEAVMRGSASTIIQLRRVEEDNCKVRSKFGDVLEIDYVAKRLAPPATVYDASIFRGTGQPFKFVLGSGVMIPGVDQGLYDMCPGEVRLLKVPPKLAVGLLDPPAKAPLEWKVDLISIDGIIRQNNNNELTREERNME